MSSLIASFVFAARAVPTKALEAKETKKETKAKTIEGRWRSADERIVIDIGHCGQDYCGQRVNLHSPNAPDRACDGTVLNIEPVESDTGSLSFKGKFDLGNRGGPYSVLVHVSASTGTMDVLGRNGTGLTMSRSGYPLNMQMVRIGEAACLPTPIS
jgi:uncharacterized protein (DUF2147 family)